jgi:hypothetical protein
MPLSTPPAKIALTMGGPSTSLRASRWLLLVDALYLAVLLTLVCVYVRSGLARSWFFSSDEYVIGAEVIRFLQLDFRQRFFDMPGTPFMFVTALVWTAYYGTQVLGGSAGGTGLALFTFQHIETLFVVMRVVTLLSFCLSVVLLYALAARLTNRVGAWFAALVLATSPAYAAFSSFVRVESLSMCFMLASLLVATYWTPQPNRRLLWTAGVLAGLSVACRFHAVMAVFPVLLLFLVGRGRAEPAHDYPEWTKALFVATGAAVVTLAAVLLLARRSLFVPVPAAWALLLTVAVAAALGCAVVWAAYRWHATRAWLLRLLPPEAADLACGMGVGVLLGTPTVIWQLPHLLQSMEMYRTSYVDHARVAWPLWTNVTWYVNLYLNVAAPHGILLALLLGGVVLAVVRRHWSIVWIAAGALLFFFSKPLNLRAATHHMIMWLPYYAILIAYPLAVVWQIVRRQPVYTRVATTAVFAALLAFLWVSLVPGVRKVAADQAFNEKRMTSIREATAWVKDNTDRNSTILVAYFCFNPDIVYSWFKSLAVPVPAPVWDGRTWVIWWGHGRTFKGQSGYALATRSDAQYLKKQIDLMEPGQGTDPYTDARFRIVRSFGDDGSRVDVFRFDDAGGAATVRGKE